MGPTRFRPVVQSVILTGTLSCASPAVPAAPTATQTPAPGSCAGLPGVACFGQYQYIEYIPGDLPLVLSVPHGGALAPAAIPDRGTGTTTTDANTIELGRAIAGAFVAQSGRAPHLILVHLRRTKLDANREVVEGAAGHPDASRAWSEYHAFIEQAMTLVLERAGAGLYVDVHGHGHAAQRLELGYLLPGSTLDGTDMQLNAAVSGSSLRLIAPSASVPFAALLRGPTSLGGLLEPAVPSVPSPSIPTPGESEYFSGGYSTGRHTATLPGLQIESHYSGIRDSENSRTAFAGTLARALASFAQAHLGVTF